MLSFYHNFQKKIIKILYHAILKSIHSKIYTNTKRYKFKCFLPPPKRLVSNSIMICLLVFLDIFVYFANILHLSFELLRGKWRCKWPIDAFKNRLINCFYIINLHLSITVYIFNLFKKYLPKDVIYFYQNSICKIWIFILQINVNICNKNVY